MAITASGLYVKTFQDELDATDIGLDLSLATHKVALVNNSHTPDFDAHDQFADLTNEVSGTGWAAGGVVLSAISAGASSLTPTLTISPAGTLMYDGNDVAVSGTTLTAAEAAVFYADALTTPVADALILLVDFTAPFSTNNGVFGIQWAATGIFTLDLTP